MIVVSIVTGIFFKAKIEFAVRKVGTNTFGSSIQDIERQNPSLILLDLEHPQALEVLKQYGAKVIAFGPHVKTELHAIARQFGAKVYTRSSFFYDIDKLLHQHV